MAMASKNIFARLAIAVLATALACGCAGEPRREKGKFTREVVPIDSVPKELLDIAKKELPEVTFDSSWKNIDENGKLHSYEIRGKQSIGQPESLGKPREVRVGLDGKVLERE